MANRVFKLPDGKGGFNYQVQTPEGEWYLTDENGNPLPEEKPKEEVPEVFIPKIKRQRKKAPSQKDATYVNFSLQIPKEDYRVISSYVHWRSLFKDECSRSSFILRSALEAVRRDREYREFMKRNSQEG